MSERDHHKRDDGLLNRKEVYTILNICSLTAPGNNSRVFRIQSKNRKQKKHKVKEKRQKFRLTSERGEAERRSAGRSEA